jgi:hypothetical protein
LVYASGNPTLPSPEMGGNDGNPSQPPLKRGGVFFQLLQAVENIKKLTQVKKS